MGKIINSIIISAISLTTCSSYKTAGNGSISNKDQAESQTESAAISNLSFPVAENTVSINEILKAYLQMKNALTSDNSSGATSAGIKLGAALKNFDKSALTSDQKKIYEDVEADAREHAEHIAGNKGNIELPGAF